MVAHKNVNILCGAKTRLSTGMEEANTVIARIGFRPYISDKAPTTGVAKKDKRALAVSNVALYDVPASLAQINRAED